jgi:hypothetical protein
MSKNVDIMGLLGLDQIMWSGSGAGCYELWKVSPCCGAPDFHNVLVCGCHWCFCGPCALTRLYSRTLGHSCSLVPGALCACFFAPCACVLTRYNLRKKTGNKGTLCGDALCVICCGPCSSAQMLRAANPSDWHIWPLPKIEIMAPNMNIMA